ncbi:MAG: hypothetical protein ACRC62_23485 [Microcoleus sp.]
MIYLIYHQSKPSVDCPDGICALWVAYWALQDKGAIAVVPDSYLARDDYFKPEYTPPIEPQPEDEIYL